MAQRLHYQDFACELIGVYLEHTGRRRNLARFLRGWEKE